MEDRPEAIELHSPDRQPDVFELFDCPSCDTENRLRDLDEDGELSCRRCNDQVRVEVTTL